MGTDYTMLMGAMLMGPLAGWVIKKWDNLQHTLVGTGPGGNQKTGQYEYGTNYLGAPLLGLVVWCVVCFALNTLLDILYEKTESIWVPAIAHGAFNAIAALPQVLVTPADAYYNVLGPMPIGLIAALPMLAAAVWLTLREMKQEEKN